MNQRDNLRRWKWPALLILGLSLTLLGAFLIGRGIYRILQPDIVGTAHATIFRLDPQSQLVTTRAYVQTVVRQRSELWYGTAEVIRIVPATIHYAVNLGEITRQSLEYDAARKVLYVPLPDVRIEAIDPDLARMETIRSLDMMRTQGGAGNELEAATEKMVRPSLEQIGQSPEAMRVARDQALGSVRRLLEAALAATGEAIEVRPYFRSEGKPESLAPAS